MGLRDRLSDQARQLASLEASVARVKEEDESCKAKFMEKGEILKTFMRADEKAENGSCDALT